MKLKRLETKDLILIALLAAFGLALKPLIKTFTHFVSTPLGIPGGTLAGGLYMMWLTLAMAMTKRFGAAALTGLLQGFIVLVSGIFGGHGALSLLTYTLPGLVADLVGLVYKRYVKIDGQILYCILANLTGTWIVGLIIMRLPKAPLIIAMSLSVLSGALGGVLAYLIYQKLKALKVI